MWNHQSTKNLFPFCECAARKKCVILMGGGEGVAGSLHPFSPTVPGCPKVGVV